MLIPEVCNIIDEMARVCETVNPTAAVKYSTATNAAKHALFKRIRKNVTSGVYAGECVCGKFVFQDMRFCPQCGQALLWPKEDNHDRL